MVNMHLNLNWTANAVQQQKLVVDGGYYITFKAVEGALQEGYMIFLTEHVNKNVSVPLVKEQTESIDVAIQRTILQVRAESERIKKELEEKKSKPAEIKESVPSEEKKKNGKKKKSKK